MLIIFSQKLSYFKLNKKNFYQTNQNYPTKTYITNKNMTIIYQNKLTILLQKGTRIK